MTRDTFLQRWSDLHGGAEASGLVRRWLGGVHVLASPLASAGTPPALLTLLGVASAWLAVALAAAGGVVLLLLAAALVALAGVLDSLDGAVAVLRERAGAWGAVLDAVCDRVGDAACAVLLWVLGAGGVAVLLAVGASTVQEYARARAGAAGMRQVGVVSVCERPVRLAVTGMTALGVAVRPGWGGELAAAGAWAWAVLAVVALGQVLRSVHVALR